jgi:hypothetical protein
MELVNSIVSKIKCNRFSLTIICESATVYTFMMFAHFTELFKLMTEFLPYSFQIDMVAKQMCAANRALIAQNKIAFYSVLIVCMLRDLHNNDIFLKAAYVLVVLMMCKKSSC